MIRVVLGSTFALGGLALATMFAGPDLVTGTTGAPIIVDRGGHVSLAAAEFDGDACSSTLLYGAGPAAGGEAGVRVVALGLRADGEIIELGMRDTPGTDGAPRATVALLFDETGALVGISKPEAFAPAAAQVACPEAPTESPHAPV